MPADPTFNYRGEYDENWPLPSHLSQEQYSHVFFRPDAHFIDGQIVPRVLGDYTHSRTVGSLLGLVYPVCNSDGLMALLSIRLQTAPTRIRVCDLAILNANAPREQVPTVPPLLCIEVLSPGQSPVEERDTLSDYLAMGVRNIWLIDPTEQGVFTFDSQGLQRADPTHMLFPNTAIHLDLTEAFAALD